MLRAFALFVGVPFLTTCYVPFVAQCTANTLRRRSRRRTELQTGPPSRRFLVSCAFPPLTHVLLCLCLPLFLFLAGTSLLFAPLTAVISAPAAYGFATGLEANYALKNEAMALLHYVSENASHALEASASIFHHVFPFVSLDPQLSKGGQTLRAYFAENVVPVLGVANTSEALPAVKRAFVAGFRNVPWFFPLTIDDSTLLPGLNLTELPAFLWYYWQIQNTEQYHSLPAQFFLGFNASISPHYPQWERAAEKGIRKILREFDFLAFFRMPYLPPATAEVLQFTSKTLRGLADELEFPNDFYGYRMSLPAQNARGIIWAEFERAFRNVSYNDFHSFLNITAERVEPEAKKILQAILQHPIYLGWFVGAENDTRLDKAVKKDLRMGVSIFKYIASLPLAFLAVIVIVIFLYSHVFITSISQLANRNKELESPTDRVIFTAWTAALSMLGMAAPSIATLMVFDLLVPSWLQMAASTIVVICLYVPVCAAAHTCLAVTRPNELVFFRGIIWLLYAFLLPALFPIFLLVEGFPWTMYEDFYRLQNIVFTLLIVGATTALSVYICTSKEIERETEQHLEQYEDKRGPIEVSGHWDQDGTDSQEQDRSSSGLNIQQQQGHPYTIVSSPEASTGTLRRRTVQREQSE